VPTLKRKGRLRVPEEGEDVPGGLFEPTCLTAIHWPYWPTGPGDLIAETVPVKREETRSTEREVQG